VRRALAIALVALVSVGAGCASPNGAPAEPTSTTFAGPPPPLPQAVIDTVLDLVARVGGSATHPSSAHYAFGTRRQALAALHMGDLPLNQIDTKVFVVVADGTFALLHAKVRKGVPPPKGDHLTVVVDPDEPGGALDVAVSAAVPRLDRVGQVASVELTPPTSVPGSPAAPS
jgi:hypothetical protein